MTVYSLSRSFYPNDLQMRIQQSKAIIPRHNTIKVVEYKNQDDLKRTVRKKIPSKLIQPILNIVFSYKGHGNK